MCLYKQYPESLWDFIKQSKTKTEEIINHRNDKTNFLTEMDILRHDKQLVYLQ